MTTTQSNPTSSEQPPVDLDLEQLFEPEPKPTPPAGEPSPPPKVEELVFKPDSGYEEFAYGEDLPVDEPLEKTFVDFAAGLNRGKGLSQEDAQSAIDFYEKEVFGALDRASQAARSAWKEDSHADPIYGGTKYAQSSEDIDAILTLFENEANADNYAPRQGLRELLESMGWREYPPIRAFLAWTGEKLTSSRALTRDKASSRGSEHRRKPSGPQRERRQGHRREAHDLAETLFGEEEEERRPIPQTEPDVSTARGLGQVLFGAGKV